MIPLIITLLATQYLFVIGLLLADIAMDLEYNNNITSKRQLLLWFIPMYIYFTFIRYTITLIANRITKLPKQ